MKAFRCILCAILLVALLLPAMSACNPWNTVEDESSGNSEPENTSEPATEETSEYESDTQPEPVVIPTLDTLPFFDGEAYQYTIINPHEDIWAGNEADITFLQNALEALCGTPIGLHGTPASDEEDANMTVPAETPIYITLGGEEMDYSVKIVPDHGIRLTGGCKETLQRAIYTFLGSFLHKNTDGTVDLINTGDFIYDYSEDKIDNSSMLEYIPTEEVTVSKSNPAGNSTLMSPDWMETLVMVEVRIDVVSIGGTFQESYDILDYYASMGVNGIWLTPCYDFGISNGYGNQGPHSVAPHLTGTDNYEEGWLVVKEFVDYAHSKGIYVFLDLVTWGAWTDSPLWTEHPDWFDGMAVWGGPAFNWKNEEFVEWFIQTAVNNIMVTGADGYRCDCEPAHAGYKVFEEIRKRLNDQGKYVMLMAEDKNSRESAYDMEQDGVICVDRGDLYANGYNFFVDGILDIVTTTLRGRGLAMGGGDYRYYTNCLCNHDYHKRPTQGNRLKIGYAAILAPYIPLWYQGEEFNASTRPEGMYVGLVDHAEIEIPANNLFFEDVKAMIAIRRTYPDLFAYWPLKHINTNLCGVEIAGWEDPNAAAGKMGTALSAYARYVSPDNEKATTEGVAFLVVPNHVESASGVGEITIPVKDAYLEGYTYFKITDMSTGRVIAYVDATTPTFTATIPYNYAGMYLVEGV